MGAARWGDGAHHGWWHHKGPWALAALGLRLSLKSALGLWDSDAGLGSGLSLTGLGDRLPGTWPLAPMQCRDCRGDCVGMWGDMLSHTAPTQSYIFRAKGGMWQHNAL